MGRIDIHCLTILDLMGCNATSCCYGVTTSYIGADMVIGEAGGTVTLAGGGTEIIGGAPSLVRTDPTSIGNSAYLFIFL